MQPGMKSNILSVAHSLFKMIILMNTKSAASRNNCLRVVPNTFRSERISMKKIIMISLLTTTLLCVVNWIMAFMFNYCIGITVRGGEYHVTYGFGIMFEEFFPLTSIDNPIKYTNKISFDPISFVLTLLIVFAISILSRNLHIKKNNNS